MPHDSEWPTITHFSMQSPPRPPGHDQRLTSHTALGHGRSKDHSVSRLHWDAKNEGQTSWWWLQISNFLLNTWDGFNFPFVETVKAAFATATFSGKLITGQRESVAPRSPALGPLPWLGWQQETGNPSALLQACLLWEQMEMGTLKLSFVYYINPYKKISFNEEWCSYKLSRAIIRAN